MARTITLISGGVDSAALLALDVEQGGSTTPLFVDYGQLASKPEQKAAGKVAAEFSQDLQRVVLRPGPAPSEGEIAGRNALLLHVARAFLGPGAGVIMLGIHAGSPYRDCTTEFCHSVQALWDVETGGSLQLAAPFIAWSKAEVYAYAEAIGVPVALTYSCEAGTEPPCGKCASCQDRKQLDGR